MNMLDKEECEKAFKRLIGMIITSPFEEDLIDYNDLKKYDTQLQNDFMDDVMVFMQLIEEHFNPQPYKFEDLKVGIWVWDDVEHEYRKILEAYVTDENDDVYVKGVPIVKHGLHKFSWSYSVFKEGRFFPITKALEYQK